MKTKEQFMIEALTNKLNYLSDRYYKDHVSEVSDQEFDSLMAELKEREEKNPEFILPNSPTKRVGNDQTKGFKKVAHSYPMLSLQDIYTAEELEKFINGTGDDEFSVECKLDGLSLSLIYENGKLVRAVTRGDGSQGDDVTAQAMCMPSIPQELFLDGYCGMMSCEIRGEVVMPFAAFEKYNSECVNEKDKFANPRNAASGTLKSYDPNKCRERGLEFIAYYLFHEAFGGYQNYRRGESGFLCLLGLYGFKTPADYNAAITVKKTEDIVNAVNEIRNQEYPFPIDGVVIKCNSQKKWEELGYTDKFYKWGVAFKFKQESLKSKLVSVDWQVAASGKVTPVANYEPLQMFGTTCRRATLNNWNWMQENGLGGLRIGDYLLLTKGGEIIPKVTGYEPASNNADPSRMVLPPSVCPVCGGPITEKGAHLWCMNPECGAKKDAKPATKVPKPVVAKPTSDKLKGKTFLVSGNFGTPQIRKEIEKAIVENGGKLANGVTLSVDYYVLPDDLEEWKRKAGSKWVKIQSYMHQDRIINKNTFESMLK